MMPNLLQHPVALFGILRAGMIVVNVNPLYTLRELEHQPTIAAHRRLLSSNSTCSHTWKKWLIKPPHQHVILTRMGDQLSTAKGTVVNFVVKYIVWCRNTICRTPSCFRSALHNGYRMQYVKPEIVAEDPAFQYTGGTTGVAKGAMLTHRNMLANLEQVNATYGPLLHPGKEFVYRAAAVSHFRPDH